MLNQVQHDEVVVVSPKTPPIHHFEHFFVTPHHLYVTLNTKEVRHPEFISGSRLCLYVSGSRILLYVTLNLFQGLVFEMLKQVQHDGVGGC